MSPATQETIRALMRGLLKSGVITSRAQGDAIIEELATAVWSLERQGRSDDAKLVEGLVSDLTVDFDI